MDEDRIETIKTRLKEIEKTQEPFWKESRMLEEERDRIFASSAKAIAVKLKWELEYSREKYNKVELSCFDSDKEDEAEKKLWNFGGDYHCSFNLDENAQLIMDDGALYLVFETVDDYKKYLKEWNLKVDTSRFREKLSSFKNDIETLEQILSEEDEK